MLLALIILLPFIGVLLPVWFHRHGRTACAWATALPPALGLVLLFSQAPAVLAGEVRRFSLNWIPELGLNLAFRLDGLSFLFCLLILAIGLLVILYGRYYLSSDDPMGKFFALLLLFMGAMLGVVTANNLLLLVLFWEATSLSSFLLISYWNGRSDARRGARMALTVTGAGGLAMLAGVLLLGHVVGSFDLDVVLASGELIREHAWYPVILVLILLGIFTKSAQFPFHFWLPHAMSAPTPVSSYLHSATMVKAGVFLLARLYPALSGTELWFILVSMVGLITMTLGAVTALFKHDLKGLLAYSTISHLGLVTLLFGLDTRLAVVAALFHIMNHATFKASLFMAVGIVDHETGTRDMRLLSGLRKYMPMTAMLGLIAAGAMAGVPLLNGFLSTEMFLGEAVAQRVLGGWSWVIPVVAVFAKVFSVAYSIRFIHSVFYGPSQPEALPKPPHEAPFFMRAPILILVGLCLLVGIVPNLIIGPLLAAAATTTLASPLPYYSLAIWHGWNLPLLMSMVAMVLGTVAYLNFARLLRLWERLPAVNAMDAFENFVHDVVIVRARQVTGRLENGSLQHYLSLLILGTVVVAASGLWGLERLNGGVPLSALDPPSVAIALIMMVTAIYSAIWHHERIAALMFLSVVGLGMALIFARFSAPDLALTQLSVEIVTIVLLMLILFLLPPRSPNDSTYAHVVRDGLVATSAGIGVGVLAYTVLTRPQQTISDYFIQNSVTGGGGTNVVNVILVDFRGFDTFGEITVMAIAAIGIFGLLDGMRLFDPKKDPNVQWASDKYPLLLLILNMPVLPLALMVAVYIFLRGHNMPGGGFIAGLIVAIALILQYLANGLRWSNNRMQWDYHPLVGAGVLLAGLTGLGSWSFGAPFLTSAHDHFHIPLLGEIELATAMLFDIGVFLAVVGATLLILANLGKLKSLDTASEENR
ncbi:monovalent cation/H+ antiporter subunit A [Natronospirillum operosum]|uniref:Monovalent cation/H+ antiporter subunit A n=1 Tax=Natronospirillum operosum TaxID=2759953 RepID=A0A4Z0WA44_9GAMM|nr:monovalent cation/H+ antiporter subunit A [Natronospirillum operosum]TGG95022.1 monovalent cation/H+ antiporter subunit A [Natronospirillum operosum]